MAIAKGIKKILKSVKSKKANKNELKNLNPEKLAKIEEQVAKNVTPLLASALGLTFAKGQVERMKGGGVVSSKSKSSGVALKGFGKEVK